ncbi:MAG: glutamate 5-kinase [Dehalococcoidia bacterium]|nr:glutamate 5-kinase [Dehalococcoidia bacterium]
MVCQRIIIKLGTSLLSGDKDYLDLKIITQLMDQVAKLHKENWQVAIVSSGAIAAGKHILGLHKEHNVNISSRQVMASVGQIELMQVYRGIFERHNITVAQALLTRGDIINRASYLNARNTLLALLELGIIPIINENDVIATDEIQGARFGDNDNLSAMVTNIIDGDLLLLLGDISGLYTADPTINPNAQIITRVDNIDYKIKQMAQDTSSLKGTGGMATKIQAAKMATACGASVIIANGREKDIITRLAQREDAGTFFPPSGSKVESRKRWMLSGLCSCGKIVIDNGAVSALRNHEGSLLPVGIKDVEGKFERGQVIDIINRNKKRIACGIANYSSSDIAIIKGAHSDKLGDLLGYQYGDEVVHRNNLAIL